MMNDLLPLLDNISSFIAALQVGILLAMSVGILVYYSKHRSILHIALVSLSYIVLTTLVAGAMIFRIFAGDVSRTAGTILALMAFALGDFALWKVWSDRGSVRTATENKLIENRVRRNEHRIAELEARLECIPGLDKPIDVRLVDEDGIHITGK